MSMKSDTLKFIITSMGISCLFTSDPYSCQRLGCSLKWMLQLVITCIRWRGSVVSPWYITQTRGLKEHTLAGINGFWTSNTSVTSSFALEATLFVAYIVFSNTIFAQLLRYVNPSSNDSSSTWLPLCFKTTWRAFDDHPNITIWSSHKIIQRADVRYAYKGLHGRKHYAKFL